MRKRLLIILSILLLSTYVFSGYSDQDQYQDQDRYQNQDRYQDEEQEQDQNQAQYYDNAKVLRVKYSEGETYVQRSYEDGFEEATMNLSIFEKDKIGTTEGRVEIYLGRLNYLRLDYDSEVEFERAPELRKTDMTLRVIKGGIYLDIQNLDNERDIEIQTPDCGVFLLNKGVYRINVNERGKTNILVHEGLAEVSGNSYSRYVRENQKIVMVDGRVAENPYFFYASKFDEFDQWNKERNSAGGYARYGTSRYLANGYEDYEQELTRYGRWTYYNEYREYIWIPYNIGSSWSPYQNGRWGWNPYYGYVWNSYDHWGYFTHHYGRWHWDNHYGWYWYPGYHWSPAWVYWFRDNDYYGWCPVSRWNRPVIIVNNRWLRNHNYHREGIPIHSRSAVVIKKHNLGAAHIDRVAINKTALGKTTITAKGFSPKERPSMETIKVINARGKAVAYKKSGFLESHKYEALKPGIGPAKATKEIEFKYKESAGKNTGKRAFKYSKSTKIEMTNTPGTNGREIKIEKKETFMPKIETKEPVIPTEGSPSRKIYKSDNSVKYKEKSVSRTDTPEPPEKNRSTEVPKIQYKPSEPKERKKTESSGALSKGTASKSSTSSSSSSSSSSSQKKIKVKDKEKHYPSFSSSERYPSHTPSNSDSSSGSYRSSSSTRSTGSTPRYNSSEKYVPSYRSQYPSLSSGRSNASNNLSSRERKSYSSASGSERPASSSTYKSYSRAESSSRASRSNYSSPSVSSNRYSAPAQSHSSYRDSSASHSSSSYSSPSSHSSHSSNSSHSSYSGFSSSGSHGSVAAKRKD